MEHHPIQNDLVCAYPKSVIGLTSQVSLAGVFLYRFQSHRVGNRFCDREKNNSRGRFSPKFQSHRVGIRFVISIDASWGFIFERFPSRLPGFFFCGCHCWHFFRIFFVLKPTDGEVSHRNPYRLPICHFCDNPVILQKAPHRRKNTHKSCKQAFLTATCGGCLTSSCDST